MVLFSELSTNSGLMALLQTRWLHYLSGNSVEPLMWDLPVGTPPPPHTHTCKTTFSKTIPFILLCRWTHHQGPQLLQPLFSDFKGGPPKKTKEVPLYEETKNETLWLYFASLVTTISAQKHLWGSRQEECRRHSNSKSKLWCKCFFIFYFLASIEPVFVQIFLNQVSQSSEDLCSLKMCSHNYVRVTTSKGEHQHYQPG